MEHTFEQFAVLPLKIRERIWYHIANHSRIIQFILVDGYNRNPILSWEQGNYGIVANGRSHFRPQLNSIPAILHTNQEARNVALGIYTKCFEHNNGRFFIYVNPNDVLLIRIPRVINCFHEQIYGDTYRMLGGWRQGPLTYGGYGWREMVVATAISVTGWQDNDMLLLCKIGYRGMPDDEREIAWKDRVSLRKALSVINEREGGGPFIFLSGKWRVLARWEQVWGGLMDMFFTKSHEIRLERLELRWGMHPHYLPHKQ